MAVNRGWRSRGEGIGGRLGISQELRTGDGRTDCFIGILAAHDDQDDLSSDGPTTLTHSSGSRWAQPLATIEFYNLLEIFESILI